MAKTSFVFCSALQAIFCVASYFAVVLALWSLSYHLVSHLLLLLYALEFQTLCPGKVELTENDLILSRFNVVASLYRISLYKNL